MEDKDVPEQLCLWMEDPDRTIFWRGLRLVDLLWWCQLVSVGVPSSRKYHPKEVLVLKMSSRCRHLHQNLNLVRLIDFVINHLLHRCRLCLSDWELSASLSPTVCDMIIYSDSSVHDWSSISRSPCWSLEAVRQRQRLTSLTVYQLWEVLHFPLLSPTRGVVNFSSW